MISLPSVSLSAASLRYDNQVTLYPGIIADLGEAVGREPTNPSPHRCRRNWCELSEFSNFREFNLPERGARDGAEADWPACNLGTQRTLRSQIEGFGVANHFSNCRAGDWKERENIDPCVDSFIHLVLFC